MSRYLFFLLFINEQLRDSEFTLIDFIREDMEFLIARSIYNVLEFLVISIIFAGGYFELTRNDLQDKNKTARLKIYPK